MKRVLVIANLYHASPRIPGLLAYLPEWGWQANLVTPPVDPGLAQALGVPDTFLSHTRLLEVPYRGDVLWLWRKVLYALGFRSDQSLTEQVKERAGISGRRTWLDRALIGYQTIFGYPDTEKLWKGPALKAALAACTGQRFDAILSSSPYPTSHMVAADLKAATGLRWVADFRDLWTQNHNYPYGRLRKRLDERLERRTLRAADAMITVTPDLAERQARFHSRPVTVLTNGFDPGTQNVPPAPLTEKMTITYTGRIYAGKQDPEKLLLAVRALTTAGQLDPERVEIRFYGPRHAWLDDLIGQYGLQAIAHQYGSLPRPEALARQRESHLLLLLNWEDRCEPGVYTGKVFEYLAARRPILCTGGHSNTDLERLLRTTRAGFYARTVADIQAILRLGYEQYRQGSPVAFQGDLNAIERFSYRGLARQLAEVLSGQALEPARGLVAAGAGGGATGGMQL